MKNITSKKVQIDKNQSTIFITVAIASVVVIASLVVSRALWVESRYYARVIHEKEIALDTLIANEESVQKLTESYDAFDRSSPNLMGGDIEGTGDRDGANSGLVLSALPDAYDFPALMSSVEKMLQGYSVSSVSGKDDVMNQSSTSGSDVVEMPFSFSVDMAYTQLEKLTESFNKSIRPFSIVQMNLSGTAGNIKADVSAKTYYQPATSLKITEETVQ